jgi:hypothetical protein
MRVFALITQTTNVTLSPLKLNLPCFHDDDDDDDHYYYYLLLLFITGDL